SLTRRGAGVAASPRWLPASSSSSSSSSFSVLAPIAVVRTNRARAEAERNLYAADMKLASQAVRDGAVDRARELLMRHRPKPGGVDLRGFEWRYLWRAIDQHEVTRTLLGLPWSVDASSVKLVRVGDTLYNLDYSRNELRAWNMTDWTPLP